VTTADSLAPDRVEPLLEGQFGRPYFYVESCKSSQRLLTADMPEGAVAICDVQTEGRGRLGRGWDAPPGTAVLCSVLLAPPPNRNTAELSLLGGLAAAETIEAATNLAAQIKWPNDVMLNRRKVAGVLAEVVDGHVVLGLGINVNQRREQLPADAKVACASLYTTDSVQRERAPLVADLVAAVERLYGRWKEGGLDALYDGLGARDFLRGRKVFLNGEAGVGIGIDRRGRLELEIAGGRRFLESGEILFER
jgi:BirA family transcriptional regulator, biotin operon repressor / biotin---[acetyl-CoA-carboxylase] ligase